MRFAAVNETISHCHPTQASCYSFRTGRRNLRSSRSIHSAISVCAGDQLQSNRVWRKAPSSRRKESLSAKILKPAGICFLACISSVAALPAVSQQAAASSELVSPAESTTLLDTNPPAAIEQPQTLPLLNTLAESESLSAPYPRAVDGQVRTVTEEQPAEKMQQELIVEGLVSYGNYKIFASGYDEKLFTAGVEYDRHSWGYFLRARVDYVAEFLPFVLLDKPATTDIWGNPVPRSAKYDRVFVPGIGITPIGFRMQWRSKKTIRPYLEAKGGLLVFTQKVPSNQATYLNFSMQSATGVQVIMTDRWGLRLGLFSDFHFSDAFIVPVNPGLDVMNANLGLSYHF
jgi:hypothetical protein